MSEKQEEILEEALEQEAAAESEEALEEQPAEETEEEAVCSEDAEDAQETGEADKTKDTQGDAKKGFFKKKKDKKDEQIEELSDKLKRQMAEFENFRKRTEKEKTQMYDMGARCIIEKILPVIDNFERGFTMVDEDRGLPFVVGMDKVYKQMLTELEAITVPSRLKLSEPSLTLIFIMQ